MTAPTLTTAAELRAAIERLRVQVRRAYESRLTLLIRINEESGRARGWDKGAYDPAPIEKLTADLAAVARLHAALLTQSREHEARLGEIEARAAAVADLPPEPRAAIAALGAVDEALGRKG